MFGADENARKGYDDPRQAVETCGLVEQMTSDPVPAAIYRRYFWADNCEDVAFNTFPAAFTSDYKALRYLTAPNMVISDSKNHAPGISNEGPFLNMNPLAAAAASITTPRVGYTMPKTAGWPHLITAWPRNCTAKAK
jgi:hypothetical protein